jgi:hypothetical protein
VTACGLNLAPGKQYRRKQMAEHRLAGRSRQTVLAELKGLVAPAGVEGGRGAANEVFGRGQDHVQHIIAVIASQAKQSTARQAEGGLLRCFRSSQ